MKRGFTLVEILIVVLVLGIIAAIALPRFSNATDMARASMLADDLRIIRMQMEVFKGQHRGVPPGYPNCDTSQAPTEDAFIAHMTMASTTDGDTAEPNTPGYSHGPYLQQMPCNPMNNKTTVEIVSGAAAFPAAPDDSHGWIYQPSTMTFKADSPGQDESGKAFFDY